jgi:putative flippase GtrA
MSFMLNRKFNFKKTDRVLFRAVSFYLTGLFGLVMSEGLLWLGTICLNFAVIPIKIASVIVVAGTQFIINKSIAFRK